MSRHLIATASLLLLAPSTFAAEARTATAAAPAASPVTRATTDEMLRSACVMVKAHIVRRGSQPIASATGTGFFVANDLILTCNHCTRIPMPHGMVNANDVQVELDGGRFVRAQVIARDPDHDLALLRVDGITATEAGCKPLSISKFGLNSGSPITIVGNFPEAIRVTRGQVLTRRIMPGFAMGDAKVRSGFSGGPVIDGDGTVQGILSQRDDYNNSIFVRSDIILSLLSRYGRTTAPAVAPEAAPARPEQAIADAADTDGTDGTGDKPAVLPATTEAATRRGPATAAAATGAGETAAPAAGKTVAPAKPFQPAAATTGDKVRVEPVARSTRGTTKAAPAVRNAALRNADAPMIVALPVRKAAPAAE